MPTRIWALASKVGSILRVQLPRHSMGGSPVPSLMVASIFPEVVRQNGLALPHDRIEAFPSERNDRMRCKNQERAQPIA